jgi:hypothetical protein
VCVGVGPIFLCFFACILLGVIEEDTDDNGEEEGVVVEGGSMKTPRWSPPASPPVVVLLTVLVSRESTLSATVLLGHLVAGLIEEDEDGDESMGRGACGGVAPR